MMHQNIKGIEGFPGYAVTSDGMILRTEKPKCSNRKVPYKLKPGLCSSGYLHVTLVGREIKKKVMIHQIVAGAFLGQKPNSNFEVNHLDGNKTNNCVSNLEYVTSSKNKKHAYRNGLMLRGSRHWAAKLTPFGVIGMFVLKAAGFPDPEIARAYGIRRESARDILRGKNWSWVWPNNLQEEE